ncbi:hypothetical protein DH2020_029944 [Rehmannia glutinosa]|uniref:Disease resistance protein n=1 Tax=Rehmannia glutinosa TaxID=99300 RepID=A0ABR0VNV1_REHGL
MAEAAFSFAVEKLGDLVIQKAGFLRGVEEQVKWLKGELERMQCFLKDAVEKQSNEEMIRKWISDIREVAQDAEDVIETFILKVDTRIRFVNFPTHLYHLGRVGEEIKSIQARLEDIRKSRDRYKIESLDDGMVLSRRRSEAVEWRRLLSPLQIYKHVVGLEQDVKTLLGQAIQGQRSHRLSTPQKEKHVVGMKQDSETQIEIAVPTETRRLSIASIVGMGGIGKSTLARIVYNMVTAFFDYRAWCGFREFNPQKILKDLILQVVVEPKDHLRVLKIMETASLTYLIGMLYDRLLLKRYFIVLDDVWEEAHWESLRSAFPSEDASLESSGNRSKSRSIMMNITTNLREDDFFNETDYGSHLGGGSISRRLAHIQSSASMILLTSRRQDIISCAHFAHKMKILNPDKSWELFLKKAFIDNTDGKCPDNLKDIGEEILKKCDGLPLAITVIGGLLAKQGQCKSEWEKVMRGMDSHLGRSESNISSILELSYHNLPPQLKSCFLCLGFFKKNVPIRVEKLVQVWIAEGLIPQRKGEETMEEIATGYLDELINRNLIQVKDMTKDDRVKTCHIHDLLRQLSITKAKEEISFDILREEEENSESLDKPRHCAIYCSREWFMVYSRIEINMFALFSSMEPATLVDVHLIGRVLNSLGFLTLKILVLDIAKNFIFMVEVPDVLWKLDSLRHLYMSGIISKVPLRINTLKNLQTLSSVSMAGWTPEHRTNMSVLRKLGIELDFNSNSSSLSLMLYKLDNFFVNLRRYDLLTMPSLDGLCNLRHLTKLKLQGKMTVLPSASDFPSNISYLTLIDTSLDEDPMPVLEKLPNLMYLKLDQAYTGSEMVISDDGFAKLKVLTLRWLDQLRNIQVGKRCNAGAQSVGNLRMPKTRDPGRANIKDEADDHMNVDLD